MLVNSISACFRNIKKEENRRVQVSKGRNCLHFNRVSFIERVVENTWSVDDLPASVLIVGVTHEQILSRKGIGLHVHVGIRNIVDEAGFANVGETSDDQGS